MVLSHICTGDVVRPLNEIGDLVSVKVPVMFECFTFSMSVFQVIAPLVTSLGAGL